MENKPLRFVVIALNRSGEERWLGCRIVPEGSMYPTIYTQVFGPASRSECETWIEQYCSPEAGGIRAVATEQGFEIPRHEAVGYSGSFSLEEAFRDAIDSLPSDPNPYPDKLYKYHVEHIGAQIGGFPGFNRMYVLVSVMY